MTISVSRRFRHSFRVPPFVLRCLAVFAVTVQSLIVLLPAGAQIPRLIAASEKDEFSESPPKRFIENVPVATKLPPAAKRAGHVPALVGAPTTGPVWTALGP